MKILLLIGLGLGLLVTGCSPRTAPVSLHTETATTKDSIHTKTEVLRDSSSYKETVEEKTIPSATVGITLTPKQLDSLIVALRSLPSTVSRSVYYQDPATRAMLTVLLDSLGNIQLNCTALELRYLEKFTNALRIIESQKKELQALKETKESSSVEVRETQLTWWQKFKQNTFMMFFAGFLVILLLLALLSKLKII